MSEEIILTKIPRASRLPWFESPIQGHDHVRYDGMVDDIKREVGRFSYGVSSDEISSRYSFITAEDARAFFDSLAKTNPSILSGSEDDDPLETLVFNLQEAAPDATYRKASEIFKEKAASIAVKVRNEERESVRLIIGPTGSGKTAFSKGLFTAGIEELWAQRVVPSRIEYRWSAEYRLEDYMFIAAARDFIAYICVSASKEDFDRFLNELDRGKTAEKIIEFRRTGLEIEVRDDSSWLGDFSKDVKNWIQNLGESDVLICTKIVEASITTSSIKYLFSFDGFDAVSPLEVFSLNEISEPVDKLCEFLDRSLISRKPKRVFLTNANAHFLIYIRDTTLSIVQRKLTKNPVGRRASDFDWICPPSYRSVASIITRRICGDRISNTDRREFVGTIVKSVRRNLESHVEHGLPRPISALFGWNVRNMKSHFGRLVLILFNRLSHDDLIFGQFVSDAGVASHVFDQFVKLQPRRPIRDYEVGRSLVFQSIPKEVGCRLVLSDGDLGRFLEQENLTSEFIDSIDVQWDDGSIGDLAFNGYFSENYPVIPMNACLLPLMLLSRLKKSKRGYTVSPILFRFAVAAGLVNDEPKGLRLIEFLLGWMAATGLVVPVRHTATAPPRNQSYRLCMAGNYLLGGAAFRVSYLDSASFQAFWPDPFLSGTGARSANRSFEESTLIAVSNSCKLMAHLLDVERNIRDDVRHRARHYLRDYNETFFLVENHVQQLLDECNGIISFTKRSSLVNEVEEAAASIAMLKGLI